MSGVNVTICDGKYTVIQEPTGGTRVLRYGKEWRNVTGDNVISGLARELQEAREKIAKLETAMFQIYHAGRTGSHRHAEEVWKQIRKDEEG